MVITFAVAVRRGTNSYRHARGRSRGSIRAVGPRSVVEFPERMEPTGKNLLLRPGMADVRCVVSQAVRSSIRCRNPGISLVT